MRSDATRRETTLLQKVHGKEKDASFQVIVLVRDIMLPVMPRFAINDQTRAQVVVHEKIRFLDFLSERRKQNGEKVL